VEEDYSARTSNYLTKDSIQLRRSLDDLEECQTRAQIGNWRHVSTRFRLCKRAFVDPQEIAAVNAVPPHESSHLITVTEVSQERIAWVGDVEPTKETKCIHTSTLLLHFTGNNNLERICVSSANAHIHSLHMFHENNSLCRISLLRPSTRSMLVRVRYAHNVSSHKYAFKASMRRRLLRRKVFYPGRQS
jgi:hypothetical protein